MNPPKMVDRSSKNTKKQPSNTNNGRSLSRSSSMRATPPPFFISIGISQPKIRIHVPKLLAKTMQRTTTTIHEDHDRNGGAARRNKSSTLPKKVASILSGLFGIKKTKHEDKDVQVLEESKWLESTGRGGGRCLCCGATIVGGDDASEVALCTDHSLLKEVLEDEFDEIMKGYIAAAARNERSRKLVRVPSRVGSRRRMRRTRSMRKRDEQREEDEEEGDGEDEKEEGNGVGESFAENNDGGGDDGDGDGDGDGGEDGELWKKKIMMGGRCKPVDFSESMDFGYYPGDKYWRYS